MVRCVLFDQTLSGPPAGADDAHASLEAAGFQVRAIDEGPYGRDGDTWLIAETVMQSPPTADDQATLMQRATDAASRYGYATRIHGVTWGWTEGGA